MSGIKNDLRKRIIEDMIKSITSQAQCVLVVDRHTSDILSSAGRMYDVMDAGVLALQNLHIGRERLGLPAIYFITPTKQSITALIRDFANAKKPQYSACHLFFTTHVSDAMMNMISSANVIDYVQTFQELNVDFVAAESRVFLFNRRKCLPNLYFPRDRDVMSQELKTTAQHLTTMCITLNEYPHIRYNGRSNQCKILAQYLEQQVKAAWAAASQQPNQDRERGTLLLVDRAMDPIAPLMHEYTYQAMVNDLLPVKGEMCVLNPEEGETQPQNFVLSEDDNLWTMYRHDHIATVLSDVGNRFTKFKNENNMAKLQSGGGDSKSSVKDMVAAMKSMPEYKDQIRRYKKHMTLAGECMTVFNAKGLKDLGDLEQDIATGLTDNGEKVNQKAMTAALIDKCQNSNIGVVEKLRLLMVFIIAQGGVAESTRAQLMSGIDARLQTAMRNLQHLGVDMSPKSKSSITRERSEEFKQQAQETKLTLMRYVPVLHKVIADLCDGSLAHDDFPYVGTAPADGGKKKAGRRRPKGNVRSARNKGGNWRKGKDGGGDDAKEEENTDPRQLVFVLGGLTFSEVRSVYQIADAKEANLTIGSTSMLSSADYIRGLADLSLDDTLVGAAPPRRSFSQAGGGDDDDTLEMDNLDFDNLRIT